jgi:hypothetical protein
VNDVGQNVCLKRRFDGVEMARNSICEALVRAVCRSSQTISTAIRLEHLSTQISEVNVTGEMVLLHQIPSVTAAAFARVKFTKRVQNALRLDFVFR